MPRKRRRVMRACMTALAAAGIWLGAVPTRAQEKVDLRLATAGAGSAWLVYATGLTGLIEPRLPPGSSIETLKVAGGIGSIKAIQAGKAQIGFSFALNSADACAGTGIFKSKQDKLRAVLGGLDAYFFGTFVTRKSGVTSWEEIAAGKNKFWLLTTRPGATGEQAVRHVLSLLGSSVEDVVGKGGFVEATGRSSTARQIKDGLADGWAQIVTRGHPAATQIVMLNDMALLPLPERVVTGMVEKHGWAEAAIPPNTFKGQPQAVRTVKAVTGIVVADSVRDDVAYTIAKTIVENAGMLPKIHVALSDFDPKRAAEPALNGNCPLHPGAARYYKEAGLL